MSAAREEYDIVVVGGGAIGLATAYDAAKRGATVAVVEKRRFFHDWASSGGATRQFRIQYNQPDISRLVLDSVPLWRELQRHTSQEILKTVGVLWFGDPEATCAEGQINRVIGVLDALDVPYRVIEHDEFASRFQFAGIPRGWLGLFQAQGAAVNLPETLRVLHRRAAASGLVDFFEGDEVSAITPGARVEVVTRAGVVLRGRRLVLCPGSYVREVLGLLGLDIRTKLWKMVSAYFKRVDPQTDYATWINFQDEVTGDDPGVYYGFPTLEWARPEYVRVGANYPSSVYDAMSEYDRTPDATALANISGWVQTHMSGLDPTPRAPDSCITSLVVDRRNSLTLAKEMVLDLIPGHDNIILCGTGWAGKFIPLLGKITVDLALDGGTTHPIQDLRFEPGLLQ